MKFELIHSSALRHTLCLCGVFFLSVIIMFTFAYFETEEELDERMTDLVQEYDATFLNIYKTSGFSGLEEQVAIQSVGARRGETLLHLVDNSGRNIAGNVLQMNIFEGWRKVAFDQIVLKNKPRRKPDSYLSFGRAFKEGTLVIGRNNFQVKEVQDGIFESFISGFMISLLLTALTGVYLARRSDRRLFDINTALLDVADGNLTTRIHVEENQRDDLARVSRDINTTLNHLSSTVESLRQISFDIAHELKTPLQRLRQDLEILSGMDFVKDDTDAAIARTLEETDKIINIFQALLRISQIEGGSRKSKFSETDLSEICDKINDIFDPVAEDNHHTLTAYIERDRTFLIKGDADLLTQMIANLVENAITHCTSPSQIDLRLFHSHDKIQLEVNDNGPGIPKGETDHVLERLYRLEKSRTTPGNGLGLSLVKAVIDLHGYDVELQDNNPGLKVVIFIPI